MKTAYPNDPLAYSILGDVAAVRQDWAGAMLNYRAALKLLPVPDVAIKLHRVLIGTGKLPEAKQFESDWLATYPKDLKFLVYSADATLLRQDYDLARDRYLSVLKQQPDNGNAANNVAWLLNRSKDSRALEFAEKAAKLAPTNPDYMDTLAQVLTTAGRFDRAIEIQKKAVDLSPDHPAYRLRLAQYYANAGQKAQAREQLQRMPKLDNSSPLAADLKRLMDAL